MTVRIFWAICVLCCFGACAALVIDCGGQAVPITTAAINCHHRLVVAASAEAACNDRLISIENIVATDPDCVAIYLGHGSGFSCVEHDGGQDDGR